MIRLELYANVTAMLLVLAITKFSSGTALAELFVSNNFQSFKSTELKSFLNKCGKSGNLF